MPADEDNEFALFRDAVADVHPARAPARQCLKSRAPSRSPANCCAMIEKFLKEALSDPLESADEFETSDTSVFIRPGLPKNVARRLRNGYWSVRYELDLHGRTTDEARTELVEFIHRARQSWRALRAHHSWQRLALANRRAGIETKSPPLAHAKRRNPRLRRSSAGIRR